MKKLDKKSLPALIVIIICLLIPVVISNSYTLRILCNVMIYGIIALSINMIVGYCGQLDFGRAAFVGLGAYCSAILHTTLGVPFIISFIAAGIFAALVGAFLGILCRYSSFDYLTLITVGFSEICRKLFQNWYAVTNGSFGFQTTRPSFFGFTLDGPKSMFYFCLLVLALCYIAVRRITKSKIGRAYMAIRDDSIAAAYAGIDVKMFKLHNFAVASFFTGIAGALMGHFTMFISPTVYTIDESLLELQMTILGGLGSLPGSIVGAAVLTIVPEISRGVYEYRLLIMGAIMVVLMIVAPKGLMGRGGVVDKIIALAGKNKTKKENN